MNYYRNYYSLVRYKMAEEMKMDVMENIQVTAVILQL